MDKSFPINILTIFKDFVEAASNRVKSNWEKNARLSDHQSISTKKTRKPSEKEMVDLVKIGKENLGKKSQKKMSRVDLAADSDVSLTPPASPTGATPSPALPKGRAVRGANRTQKAKQALAQLFYRRLSWKLLLD